MPARMLIGVRGLSGGSGAAAEEQWQQPKRLAKRLQNINAALDQGVDNGLLPAEVGPT